MTNPVKWTGAGESPKAKLTPELLAIMVDLLPTVGSLRDLSTITGLRTHVVRREMAPFLAIMKLQGTHPKCACGKDKFHPRGCAGHRAKANHSGHFVGRTREKTAELLARRELAVAMLLAGERLIDIDKDLGLYKGAAKYYRRGLTPAQRAERDAAIAARADDGEAPAVPPPANVHPFPPLKCRRRASSEGRAEWRKVA